MLGAAGYKHFPLFKFVPAGLRKPKWSEQMTRWWYGSQVQAKGNSVERVNGGCASQVVVFDR
ncbi:hypothetical protein B0H10DRAFT_2113269 [Mycena sp. CBHHK59/15]|nr:hypothetical protein B0H10DRAFT_2113269 [Mycena sp. CBHHK59/15]